MVEQPGDVRSDIISIGNWEICDKSNRLPGGMHVHVQNLEFVLKEKGQNVQVPSKKWKWRKYSMKLLGDIQQENMLLRVGFLETFQSRLMNGTSVCCLLVL